MGFGVKSVNPIVINILIGEGLGYNREEGFTLVPRPLGANANVQIALDKGDLEFGVGTPSFQLPLYAKGELPPIVNFYEYTYPYKWDVAVKPESPLRRYEDLKGKKIGVSDLGTTDYPVTRAVLRNLGIDPDKDVQWIAVGAGVSAGVALQRGVIDALAYFDTGFGQIEAAGIAMRMLPRPKDIPLIGGLFLSARADFLKANRKLAVGYARAVAKSSEFLLANPEAGAKGLPRPLSGDGAARREQGGGGQLGAVRGAAPHPALPAALSRHQDGLHPRKGVSGRRQVHGSRHRRREAADHQRPDRRDQRFRPRQDHRRREGVQNLVRGIAYVGGTRPGSGRLVSLVSTSLRRPSSR